MPIPKEFEGAPVENMNASFSQAEDFLNRVLTPEEYNTIAVPDDVRLYIYKSMGLPPDLNGVGTFNIIAAPDESIQYRVILSPKRHDVYLLQERRRKSTRFHAWGHTGIYRLGEARNKRFRHSLHLPE